MYYKLQKNIYKLNDKIEKSSMSLKDSRNPAIAIY